VFLAVHTNGYLNIDVESGEGQQVVGTIDSKEHAIALDLTSSDASWSTSAALLSYDNTPTPLSGIRMPGPPAVATIRCGIEFMDTGSNPNYSVRVDDVTFEDCP